MKQQPTPPAAERKRTQNVSNTAGMVAVPEHRTYKPRTPITKTYVAIMNDPFVFSC
jgi:hypothetical protein